ncbi:uncharacterized protein LOC144860536 [Branchiostoma floridae x Branchiostoma japonicum]
MMWTNVWMQQLLFLLLYIMLSRSSRLDTCDMCPPGNYVAEVCKDGLPHTTKCEPCPPGTYLQYYNHMHECLRHRHCTGPNMVERLGDATRNTICNCKEGYRKVSLDFDLCIRNALCPPGTGVTERGNECKRCPRGFYSDQHSHTDFCQPWTNCTENGWVVVERGSRTKDVKCGQRNITNKGEKMPSTDFADQKVAKFTTPIMQPDLQLDAKDDSSPLDEDASVLKMSEIIVITLLSFLTTCVTSLVSFGLWVKCKKGRYRCPCSCKRQKLAVPVEAVHESENFNGEFRVHVGENGCHYDLLRGTAQQPSSYHACEPLTSRRMDRETCVVVNVDDGEYSTLPKTHPKSAPTTTWPSNSSLPTAPSLSAGPTTSTRLKSESSEEYMHEMQRLMAEGYATVLSASGAEYLAAELGPAWRQVAKRLGIKQDEIDHIWNENRQDLERQIFKMLSCWQRDRTGRASISDLYGALLDSNKDNLRKKLQEIEHSSIKSEETKVYRP